MASYFLNKKKDKEIILNLCLWFNTSSFVNVSSVGGIHTSVRFAEIFCDCQEGGGRQKVNVNRENDLIRFGFFFVVKKRG